MLTPNDYPRTPEARCLLEAWARFALALSDPGRESTLPTERYPCRVYVAPLPTDTKRAFVKALNSAGWGVLGHGKRATKTTAQPRLKHCRFFHVYGLTS